MSEDINKSGPTPLPLNVIRKTSGALIPFINVRTGEKTDEVETEVAQRVFEARARLVEAKMKASVGYDQIKDAIQAVDHVLMKLEMI